MNNTKTRGRAAGLCFLLYQLSYIVRLYRNYIIQDIPGPFYLVFWTVLVTVAFSVFFAAALLFDSITMAKIIKVLSLCYLVLDSYDSILYGFSYDKALAMTNMVTVAVEVIVVIALFLPGKRGRELCYTAVALLIVHQAALILQNGFAIGRLWIVLTLAGYLFLGMYLDGKGRDAQLSLAGQSNPTGQSNFHNQPSYDAQPSYGSQPSYNNPPNYNSQPSYSGQPGYSSPQGYGENNNQDEESSEKLTKLQALFEKGIITREEFTEKTNQIKGVQPDRESRTPSGENSVEEKITRLKTLRDKGILTQEEFYQKVDQLLNRATTEQ